MQQNPPKISVRFHTVFALFAADFQVLISLCNRSVPGVSVVSFLL
jgi:hypothetical protein